MESTQLDNMNPAVFDTLGHRSVEYYETDDAVTDEFDAREVFDLVRDIRDPEHPLTLEQLNVVSKSLCEVYDTNNNNNSMSYSKNNSNNSNNSSVRVQFTPTIPHCSMAALIGLSIRLKLLRCLPARFKVVVVITPGSHASEAAINKQLADKERVAAALENPHLLAVINKCLAG